MLNKPLLVAVQSDLICTATSSFQRNFVHKGDFEMKIFKTIVLVLMIAITLQAGYYAILYKVQIATGVFLICLGLTLFVASDGGMNRH